MIVIPIGTKAQLIKMAPVIKALEAQGLPFDFVLTGQHQETMADLIDGFDLPQPAYSLAPVGEASSKRKLLKWLLQIFWKNLGPNTSLHRNRYRFCLVHGDTLSTLVATILARLQGIQVVHIEAGLRSKSILHPFPEELTRLAVSRMSSIFYCSGKDANSNAKALKPKAHIVDIGENTLLDSVRIAILKGKEVPATDSLPYCVASIHRFENITNKDRFLFIVNNIINISRTIQVYFVLHSATKHQLMKHGLYDRLSKEQGIQITPRMSYFDFIRLISAGKFLISDGGSNQEECSYLDIPCLLMRQRTERSEGLGRNVYLSNYEQTAIDTFVAQYSQSPRITSAPLEKFNVFPSKTIAQDLELLSAASS